MKLIGENRSTRGETCTSATLSTTNHTWTKPELNPRLSGWRPAANRLSHGTAFTVSLRYDYRHITHLVLQVDVPDKRVFDVCGWSGTNKVFCRWLINPYRGHYKILTAYI
jgi:hypothetical protein